MTDSPAVYGIIPARFASSRFPGKPLAPILGKPMFVHVFERARRCPDISGVHLATDDERIAEAAREYGVPFVMTRADHPSGTDRVFEAARTLGIGREDVVINIQGDEPALDPRLLSELAAPFSDPEVMVTTPVRALTPEQAAAPDRVKAVTARNGDALYFSRAPIPFDRDGGFSGEGPAHLGHIGIYAFRFEALERFTRLPPSPLEGREQLEQLRLLENGIPIRVVQTQCECHGVDRPEDIALVTRILEDQD